VKASVQILTMGARPELLKRAVDSALAQTGADVEVVVVSNGAMDLSVRPPAHLLELPENLGVSGGRNRGIAESAGDVLFFIDDDGAFASTDAIATALAIFESHPEMGICSFLVKDLDGPPQRRWVPRLRAGDPLRAGEVTTYLGGASAIRREVFDRCGPYPEEFWFGHEETDLAWRALDAGYTIRYEPSVVVLHPSEAPSRHETHFTMTARNRVFLARRRLPWMVAAVYLATWLVLGLVRAPAGEARRAYLAGFREGMTKPCGERKPMSWRTVWRMTKLGRPPVV
jgi:GT2 family glycosyltransferase